MKYLRVFNEHCRMNYVNEMYWISDEGYRWSYEGRIVLDRLILKALMIKNGMEL